MVSLRFANIFQDYLPQTLNILLDIQGKDEERNDKGNVEPRSHCRREKERERERELVGSPEEGEKERGWEGEGGKGKTWERKLNR